MEPPTKPVQCVACYAVLSSSAARNCTLSRCPRAVVLAVLARNKANSRGFQHTPATRRKMSAVQQLRRQTLASPETCARMTEALYRRAPVSDATRAKMSASAKRRHALNPVPFWLTQKHYQNKVSDDPS